MDIEEVAESDPDAIARLHVDPLLGFQEFHGRRLAFEAGVDADVVRPVGAMLAKLYEVFVAEEATLVEVNPLIVTPERDVKALDAKVTLDDNALFRHPDNAELRDPSPRGSAGADGQGARADLRQARRRHRDPRQRRRAGHVDARRGRPGGRLAGQLPRRRRRLEGRGDHQRGRGDPVQPERQGGAVQHLRRHHPLRRGGARADRGVRPDQPARCRSWCGWTGPTTWRAASCWPRPSCPTSSPSRRWTAPRTRSCELGLRHEHPRRHEHQARRVRDHRPRGHVPLAAQPRLRNAGGRRRHARQGRPGRRGHPGVQHLPRRGGFDRRQHGDDLRAAPLRRRLDPGGRGRRHRADHRDHRGHPRPRRAARVQRDQEERPRAADRAELPGHPVARQGQRRDHPGRVLQARATSAWSRARAR